MGFIYSYWRIINRNDFKKMTKELNEDTGFKISIKTLIDIRRIEDKIDDLK